MPFLSNGPANSTETVNEQLEWLHDYFYRNPRFKGLWVMHDGKPLTVLLYTSPKPLEELPGPHIDDTKWTLRCMGAMLDSNKLSEHGYWSWMDGTPEPTVTFRDGKAEVTTPTPSCFTLNLEPGLGGWLGSQAVPRRNGTTFVRSFDPAFKHRPQYVLFHQWNEFTGQLEGYPMAGIELLYGDSYSVERSDDLEPVSLSASGYRGDCGGWGFLYFNLSQALIDLYKQPTPITTVMAVYPPDHGQIVAGSSLTVAWETIGKVPDSYTLLLDDAVFTKGFKRKSFELDLSGLEQGPHTVSVVAEGAVTYYALGREKEDVRFDTPVPLRVDTPFVITGR